MPPIRVAINGLGRIGRLALRILLAQDTAVVVGINDPADTATLAHLLQYDSNQGTFPETVCYTTDTLIIQDQSIAVCHSLDPVQLPWKSLAVDIVLECTGQFTNAAGASKHLTAGAQRVVISAPAQDNIPTIVLGVNDHVLQDNAPIISNASCTTNCLAPIAKVLDENFGIVQGYINTVHAYTADQRLQDASHKDLRRARAATQSIIPTSTGAARAVGKVLPQLQGKLHGLAMRVPVATGSVVDFTVVLQQAFTTADINNALQKAAQTSPLRGILAYTEDPIVSVDVVGSPYSCIVDSQLTMAHGHVAKVIGWYDNEMGYVHRLADLIRRMGVRKHT